MEILKNEFDFIPNKAEALFKQLETAPMTEIARFVSQLEKAALDLAYRESEVLTKEQELNILEGFAEDSESPTNNMKEN